MQRSQLRHAITSLEQQRSLLGSQATDVMLDVLREELAGLDNEQHVALQDTRRKQVTVLFAKVEGLTRLAEEVSSANVLYLINMLWRRFDKLIIQHGGHVDTHVGDTVMGVFGVPDSAEDDAERALRAALALRSALANFLRELRQQLLMDTMFHSQTSSSSDIQLTMQVGINSGAVVLGEVASSGKFTVIGDAVNVASRLQQAASPGSVLVADATLRLAPDIFSAETIDPIKLRGKRDPVPVHTLLGMHPRLFFSSPRGVQGVRTRMIGRAYELQQLQDAISAVDQQKSAQLVLLSGEAGVGKSRLLMELLRQIDDVGSLQLLRGRMEPRWQSIPYALVRDLFTLFCNISDADSSVEVHQKLLQGMTELVVDEPGLVVKTAAPIGHLIGLRLGEPTAKTEPQQIEQAEKQLIEFFKTVADQRPLLLLLEDLHWADEASLAFVERLLTEAASQPLLVVGTTRPTLFEQYPMWATAVPIAQTRLNMQPLSPDEARELVADILRYVDAVPPQLVQLIVQTAEGNPFYVEELIKVLIEDGVIVPGTPRWTVATQQIGQVRVPASLTGVIQARMDRLSRVERLVLQQAAVFGREFSESAVLHLTSAEVRSVASEKARQALQTLQTREILYRVPRAQLNQEPLYAFKHAVFREVAYESVLLRERPDYHREAAHFLVGQSGERLAENAAVIAEHFELAGENGRAAEMYEMAAVRAVEMHNTSAAIGYFEKVLDLLANLTLPLADALGVRAQLGDLLWRSGRLLDAEAMFVALLDAATQEGDLVWQAVAGNALARLALAQAQWSKAAATAREAERLARLMGQDVELLEAQFSISHALAQTTSRAAALMQAEQAWETSRKLGGVLEIARSLALLVQLSATAEDHIALDYVDQLGDIVRRDLHRVQVSPQSVTLYCLLGQAYADLGDQTNAVQHLSMARELDQLFDGGLLSAEAAAKFGDVAARFGGWSMALGHYRRAVSAVEPLSENLKQFEWQLKLADAALRQGEIAEAVRALTPVQLFAAQSGQLTDWAQMSELQRLLDLLPNAAE